MDKPESSFIKMAHANIDTGTGRSNGKLEGPVKAFFWLALEAIRQLARIADSLARIALPEEKIRVNGIYPEE